MMLVELGHPPLRELRCVVDHFPAEFAGGCFSADESVAMLLPPERFEEPFREEVAVRVVHDHGKRSCIRRNLDSERILESDEGRDFVANTVVVEREEDVHVQKQAAYCVDLGSK